MAKILIVDDERSFRETLVETLGDLGHRADAAASFSEALKKLETEIYEAIFIDFRMPEVDGLTAIKLIHERFNSHSPPIVMITAFFDSRNTIEAMKLGAFDHLSKPIRRADIERVLAAIAKSYPSTDRNARPENAPLALDRGEMLIGQSEAMRSVLKMVGRLAGTLTSVLLNGETGTGKEVIAKAIHENSARAKGPFVAINCAAIPENLLESELFGHVKGSFTGAAQDRKGSFQLAEGGTLFLDEIGDMNLSLQAKILRALQEKEVVPVGSSRPIRFDARILAATHHDLQKLVERKSFREDLFFRLSVVELKLPPLRERKDDIEVLANYFLGRVSGDQKFLSESALQKLQDYSWPGNIRELKNVIERALVLAPGRSIDADDIRLIYSSAGTKAESDALDLPRAVAELEKSMILNALAKAEGNRSEAARRLGIQRQALYAKIKEHQIEV